KCEQPLCEACKGSRQSPVNIVTQNVVYNKSLTPLTFEGYDVKGSAKWDVENNGHTVKVTLSTSPKVGGGGLRRKYKAVEFHLHWGVPGEPQHIPGSEHSIDGEKYPMELHLVHIREDASNVAEAKQNPDGLAVLAFFVKVGREIFNCPPQIVGLRDCVNVTAAHNLSLPIFLNKVLPPSNLWLPWRYYRYEGFLTTPDCYEGVIWTIFETPIELSERQVSAEGQPEGFFGGGGFVLPALSVTHQLLHHLLPTHTPCQECPPQCQLSDPVKSPLRKWQERGRKGK
uniref:Carbonic anhydrase n=1 Tax=Malurus cyaneus samueli TaxID=2593467 RepID=A0A8C5X8L8_9PASS